jgi:hypothetical protein
MLGAMQQSSRYFVTAEADSPFEAIQLAEQWVEADMSDVQIVDGDGQAHDLAAVMISMPVAGLAHIAL